MKTSLLRKRFHVRFSLHRNRGEKQGFYQHFISINPITRRRKKRKIIRLGLLGVALIAFIVVVVGVRYYLDQRSLTSFASSDWHFSFKYNLDNWQEVVGDEKKLLFADVNFAFKKIRSTKTTFTIKVSEKEGKKEIDVEPSIKDLDEKLPERLKEFNKIESKEIKFLGTPAVDYTFRYNYQPIDLLPKDIGIQREIIFFKNEILYTLMLSADPSEFEEANKEFQKVLNSFRVGGD